MENLNLEVFHKYYEEALTQLVFCMSYKETE